MKNFKCFISYDGTNYHGFQRQENALSIQQVLEDTLEKIIGEKCTVYGCSRTDTGVHANEYCFNFHHNNSITENGLKRALNGLLPDDIAVNSCEEVDESFHARYDTTAKEYIYKIHNSQTKNPFFRNRFYLYKHQINVQLIQEASKYFVGTHDFKSFSAKSCTKKNTIRTIYYFDIFKKDDIIEMHIKGDGFLYNMIRIMVGTLIFVNEGKYPPEEIVKMIEKKDRTFAGKTAPAHGLYLNKIFY